MLTAIDYVTKIERTSWVPRFVLLWCVKLYVQFACLPEHKKILQGLSKGDLVLDFGANVGLFTLYFASKGCSVMAFEPDPHAYEQLQKRVSDFSNVTLVNKAVANQAGKMTLYRHAQFEVDKNYSQSSSLIQEKSNVSSASAVEVDVLDAAELISSLDRLPKLIKMDVEGAEMLILNRLYETGKLTDVGHVLVEPHGNVVPGLSDEIGDFENKLKLNNITNVDFTWH